MKVFTVEKQQNLRDFTDETYPQGSFYFNTLLKKSDIRINGKKVSKNVTVYPNDVVEYYLTKSQEEKEAFRIIYEDDNVIVTDKDNGVNSEAVFYTLHQQNNEVLFIHRLDRNTQGLMIFAKNESAENELLSAFKDKTVDKTYVALCVGIFAKKKNVMTAYLKKNADNSTVRVFDVPQRGAEKIITEYAVEEEFENYSRVKIVLHTGKTHQIRAHFAFIGHPVIGDMKYGEENFNREQNSTRQKLIAKKLCLHTKGCLAYLNGKEFISNYSL